MGRHGRAYRDAEANRPTPRTAAGRRTLDRYAWDDERDDMLADILAIEAEAPAQDPGEHAMPYVEGDEDPFQRGYRLGNRDGYEAGKAEAAAPVLDMAWMVDTLGRTEPKDYARMWLDGGGDPTFDQIDGFLFRHFNARAVHVEAAAPEPFDMPATRAGTFLFDLLAQQPMPDTDRRRMQALIPKAETEAAAPALRAMIARLESILDELHLELEYVGPGDWPHHDSPEVEVAAALAAEPNADRDPDTGMPWTPEPDPWGKP